MLNLSKFFDYNIQTPVMEEQFDYTVSFIYGPRVNLLSNHSKKYLVEFYERFGEDWALVHTEHKMSPFTWFEYLRHFRTEWRIKIWGWKDKPVLLADHTYNEQDKKVYLHFESNRFDVHLNWFMKAKQFAAQTGAQLIIESRFKDRLQNTVQAGSNIILVDKMKDRSERDQYIQHNDVYAMYFIGRKDIQSRAQNWWESGAIFVNHGRHYKSFDHPVDWVSMPDEQLFESILGL